MLDLSEAPLWQGDVLRAFRNATSPEHAEALMGWARSRQAQRAAAGTQPEPEPGYLDALRELAETADAFVFLGERERDLTARLLPALPEVSRIVRNPVDAALFSSGDPALFRSAYGLTDYVLCVARIEHRKNQLLLALALRDTGIPLVLIGHPGDEEYLRLVKSFGGPNLVIIDRLEPGSPMLRSAIAGARVFTLPSWAEGAPLAALEAGAAGARMVLSDRSSEREYFGDLALYCDPADPASIRQAVLAAWDAPWTADDRATLVRHVAQSFSWDRHVVAATSVYEEVAHRRAGGILPPALRRRTPAAPALPVPAGTAGPFEIVFDLTTSANNAGTRSGIVRVERSLCECLLARKDVRVRLVVWRSAEAGFVEIPPSIVARGLLHSYLQSTPPAPVQHGALRPGSRFLVVGSSWMQNAAYSHSLSTFTVEHGLELSILMHDLTPVLFPHWFLEGYSGRFTQNLAILLQTADRLLAYSDNTRSDLQDLALEMDLDLCPIEKFRLADAIGAFALEMSDTGRQIQAKFSRLPFILATGGIHARKNYGLLYDVWSMLRQRMGDRCPHLVIAGGVLWNGAETARTIREDRLVNRHIHILDDVDDAALDWLYRNCLFTVYPSLYEGWGLPVGESLSYGKVCVASNRSSVPEIAPTLTDLLDPLDRQVWASVIQHYATSKSAREAKEARIRAEYVPTAWEDSAAGVLTALSVPQAAPRRDLYTLGDLVLLGAEDAVPRHRRSGWYPRESWGAWTSSGTARLRLVLTAEPDEDLVFSLVFKYFTPLDKPNRCTVVANGTKVAEWDVRLTAQKDAWPFTASQALIPKHLVGADRRVEIELISTSRHKVSDVVPSSQDQRLLGLGVTGFCLHKASAMPNLLTLLGTRADVRNALGAPPAQDLARRFRSNAARPVYPVNQCWPAAPAEGAAYLADPALSRPEGFQSRSGSLWLRGGTVDLDLHRDAILEAVVVASVPEGGRVRISVLVNSELAGDWDIADGSPTALSMVLPRAALAKQDPAEIVLVSDAATGGLKPGAGEFVVAQMALRQPAPDVLRAVPSLAAGQTVELSDKNPAVTQAFLTQGWYPAEEFGVWSIGDLGRLGATVDPHAAGNAVLALEVQALASGKPDDTATVAVEGTRIAATIDVAAPGVGLVSQTVFLNLSALTQGQEARIAFKRNAVVSPAVLGLSPDARVLGLQVSRMSLIALQPMPENAFIPASGEELDRFVLQDGWHGADDFGRWTDRRRGDLWFRVPPGVPAGVRLMLHLTAIAPDAGTGATVEVLINDRMVETRSVPHMDVQVVVVDLHDGLLAGNDLVKLSLVRDNPVVPQEIGMNGDGRCLGVLLTGMELQHTDAAARTMEGAVPVVSP